MNQKILIVDVDPVVHCRFIQLLNEHAVDIYSAFCPLDALRTLKRSSYDLIITELILPNLNGLDFIRQVKAGINCSRIVFLTTQLMDLSHEDCSKYDIVKTLVKPKATNLDLIQLLNLSK